ncbi:hypothetical protein HPP92_021722 [Vanilla planifolia]|uniref:Uncharacterized protein n=1 Tax=Vanilla planifolia TaxID=51239 RepID=A0A835UHW0_VANPL|nr:hypothetical protein HPP92_021722 [Vanilla planifolia]
MEAADESMLAAAEALTEVGEDSSAAVAGGQPSPATPLDFATASVPSTSGSEDAPSSFEIPPAKRRLSGEPSVPRSGIIKKVAERSASVPVAIPALKPIRRQGKKKTTAELRAQERALVDENTMLEKMVESKRKEMEALIAENVRLKSEKIVMCSRVVEM